MLELVFLLENKYCHKFSCRLNQVDHQDFPIFCCTHSICYVYKPPRACCCEASPQHDAVTTMLHGEDSVFVVMCSVLYLKNEFYKEHKVETDEAETVDK